MKNRCEAPIGVFDSGVGGLTVVREIMRNLPNEEIVYFGDTARVPYGSKSKETVTRYSRQIVRFLQSKEVKAIVVACNTASAYALETIKKELDIPIIGVVEPGARVACETTVNDRIGVIGTEATVHSGIYTSFIRRQKPDVQVVSKACPLFVPLVEEGWLKDPITMEVARRYLEELLQYCGGQFSVKTVSGRAAGEGYRYADYGLHPLSAAEDAAQEDTRRTGDSGQSGL